MGHRQAKALLDPFNRLITRLNRDLVMVGIGVNDAVLICTDRNMPVPEDQIASATT